MMEILRKFNWLQVFFPKDESARRAKERLRLVLIQDQASLSADLLNLLRDEMIGVVSRYLEIDSSRLEMGLERKNEQVALAATIPILRVRKEGRMATQSSPASGAAAETDAAAEKRNRRPRRRYH